MLSQKRKYARKTKAEKRIEEVRVEVEKVLKRLRQIEVQETWMKTGARTSKEGYDGEKVQT